MPSCHGNRRDPGQCRPAAGYRGRLPPRSAGRQLGLFGNPVRAFTLEELTETVRKLLPGQADVHNAVLNVGDDAAAAG